MSALMSVWGALAAADGLALVLGNDDYRYLDDNERGTEPVAATGGLADLGFDILRLANGSTRQTLAVLDRFAQDIQSRDRVVLALSGRFVTDGDRTWFLAADARAPAYLTLDQSAVSLDSLMKVIAPMQGRALVFLSHRQANVAVYDPWLSEGIGDLEIPQGVTVVRGGPRNVAAFMGDELVRPNADLTRLIAANDGVSARGYLPRSFPFMAGVTQTSTGQPVTQTIAPGPSSAERASWALARQRDRVDGYEVYLRRYPNGTYASAARQAIEAIQNDPDRDTRRAEDALGLSRNQRRSVQRDLTDLGYDTRGVDGIFGRGTRAAIENWQAGSRFDRSGYLTQPQLNRMEQQAQAIRAERDAEAERVRVQAQREERRFWDQTGAQGTQVGLERYLERYPNGAFAAQATARLQQLRPTQPTGPSRADERRAREAEDELRLNPITRQLVQLRLAALGMNPGRVDGVFDDRTRIAIRRFQNENNLDVTGYLSRQIVVRLIQGN